MRSSVSLRGVGQVSAVQSVSVINHCSYSSMGDGSRVHNQTGQCAPLLSPVMGSLKVVAGDGTSVGTVIRLQCPSRHRPVTESQMSCVWSSNNTHWTGGLPECKPLSRFEDDGFRLALLISFISSTIILIMSIIFITSCLVRYVRQEERRKMERMRKREEAEFWQQMDVEGMEVQREVLHNQRSRKTNNNNNNSNIKEERHMGTSTTDNHIFTLGDLHTNCRCYLLENGHPQYLQPSTQFPLRQPLPTDHHINTHIAPIPHTLFSPQVVSV